MELMDSDAEELAGSFAAHLTEFHHTLDPRERQILEHLFLRALDPVTRRQIRGVPPFSDDELEFLATLDGCDP